MAINLLGTILAFIISFTDYRGLFGRMKKHTDKFISFTAGLSITYILLQLLPEIYLKVLDIGKLLFIPVLIGFISHHVIEKYIFEHVKKRVRLKKDLTIEHVTFNFIYHFIIGINITMLALANYIEALLFFVPIYLHTTLDRLPKERFTKNELSKILISSAALLGSFVPIITTIPTHINFALLGFIGGVLLYFVVREAISKDQKGRPEYFMLGVLTYSMIIISIWTL